MLTPLSQKSANNIIKSFKRVFETEDIDNLTKDAYHYIYLAIGFIAHYDIHGFKDVYANTSDFKKDILYNQGSNQWNNFSKKDADFEYYFQKRNIYNAICNIIQSKYKM